MAKDDQPLSPHPAATPPVAPDTRRAAPDWDAPPIPLSDYLRVIKRHRYRILGFIGVIVAVTWVASVLIPPVYESTATIEFDSEYVSTQFNPTVEDQFLATQITLIQSDSVLRPVAEHYRLLTQGAQTPSGTENAVAMPALSITRPLQSSLLLIRYRSSDPRLSADMANAIARSYHLHALADFFRKQADRKKASLFASLSQLSADLVRAKHDRMAKEAAWRSVQGGATAAALTLSQEEILGKLAAGPDNARKPGADQGQRNTAAQGADLERQYQNVRASLVKRAEVEHDEAVKREAMLQKSIDDSEAALEHLDNRSVAIQAAIPGIDPKRYDEAVKTIQSGSIEIGFANDYVRILEIARPGNRISHVKVNLAVAFIVAAILAIGVTVISTQDTAIRRSFR